MIEKILFKLGYIKKPKFRLRDKVNIIDNFPPLNYKISNIYCRPYASLIKDAIYSYELFRENSKSIIGEDKLKKIR